MPRTGVSSLLQFFFLFYIMFGMIRRSRTYSSRAIFIFFATTFSYASRVIFFFVVTTLSYFCSILFTIATVAQYYLRSYFCSILFNICSILFTIVFRFAQYYFSSRICSILFLLIIIYHLSSIVVMHTIC